MGDQNDDSLSEPAWKMMKSMGYEHGRGLGRHAQGQVKPVELSKQKGRLGLGYSSLSTLASELYDSNDSNLAWSRDELDADVEYSMDKSERIWSWSSKPYQDALSSTRLHEWDVAMGSPITIMDNQCTFCSSHLLHQMLAYKNQLNGVEKADVSTGHMRSNPYESIKKVNYFLDANDLKDLRNAYEVLISCNGDIVHFVLLRGTTWTNIDPAVRAAMKMANMDALLNGLFTNSVSREDILYFADVCAGPGGFSEYVLWRRFNQPFDSEFDRDNCQSVVRLGAKGFGMTLSGKCDFRETDFLAGPPQAFTAHYGSDKDGDITKWTNLSSFAAFVAKQTAEQGVHLFMADGGFDVSKNYNLQEVLSKKIYLCQSICALTTLRPGGHFVCKLFDVFTEFTVDLIYLMGQFFESVMIVKPVTSRPANSERYFVCKNFQSLLGKMAGCPPVPNDKAPNSSISNCEELTNKCPRSGAFSRISNGTVSNKNDTRKVNEKVRLCGENEEIEENQDVVKLCPRGLTENDMEFMNFIKTMNEEFVQFQCKALSKLLHFIRNSKLESKQKDVGLECFKQWQVPLVERQTLPWPLLNCNRSSVIRTISGTLKGLSESISTSFDEYCCQLRLDVFSKEQLDRLQTYVHNRIALVFGRPSSFKGELSSLMLVYSTSNHQKDTFCMHEKNRWSLLKEDFPNLEVRLPPGTLVFGQVIYEYTNLLRKPCLFICDVLCMYGKDCGHFPYRQRLQLMKQLESVVNFVGMSSTHIRVPPVVPLTELKNYIDELPSRKHKDSHTSVPVHVHPDGRIFQPCSLLLVQYLEDPWIEVLSRSTGNYYYSNRYTNESTFKVPENVFLHFKDIRYTKIPWSGDIGPTVMQVVQQLNNLT